ncbi:hypothetical protein C8R44DRAFT_864652 [Mycena epipterygia]|nr:hypothetical protein C8R44DRAFT_864652 [Mycena epipterygia]
MQAFSASGQPGFDSRRPNYTTANPGARSVWELGRGARRTPAFHHNAASKICGGKPGFDSRRPNYTTANPGARAASKIGGGKPGFDS